MKIIGDKARQLILALKEKGYSIRAIKKELEAMEIIVSIGTIFNYLRDEKLKLI